MKKKIESDKDYIVSVSGFGSRNTIAIKWFFSADFESEAAALKAARDFYASTLKDITIGCGVHLTVINWKGTKRERTIKQEKR